MQRKITPPFFKPSKEDQAQQPQPFFDTIMKLNSSEVELVGNWVSVDNQIRGDATCERIQWLMTHHLKKVANNKQSGGWETLFQDPDDGRFWERTYPQSGMHGGGPPSLKCLAREQAKAKYGNEVF